MGLLTLLPLLGFSAFLARSLRMEHSVALLHAVGAIVLILYVGGLAQILWWTALAVHLFGVGLLGYDAWQLNERGAPVAVPLPYGLLLLLAVAFWLIHGQSQYFFYDEYSHWGVYLKEMLALDGYWQADTNSMHPRYPPAAPLWQYLFSAFREPSEGRAYLGQFVLLMTPLLVLFERLEWRRHVLWILAVLALAALALSNFGLGVNSLYVDHVIGTWFIGTILCFVFDSPVSVRRISVYAVPLAALALLKESSLAFSLAAAAILTLLALYRGWRTAGARASALGGIGTLAAIAAPAILCVQIWGWDRDRIGAPEDLEAVGGIVSGLAEGAGSVDAEQGAEITRRFIEVFREQQLSNDRISRQFNAFSYPVREYFTDRFRLTTLGLFVVFAFWWIALLRFVLEAESRRLWGIVTSGVVVTAAGYIGALYLTYRFAAGEYGLTMSSYTRYVHTVALPMLVLCFAPLLPAFRSQAPERSWRIAGRRISSHASLVIAGIVGLYAFETPYLRSIIEPNPRAALRVELEPVTEPIRNELGRASLWVYLPTDTANGFVGQMLQYLLSPAPTFVERAEDFLEGDTHEILERWAEFEYVWLPTELAPEAKERVTGLVGTETSVRLFHVRPEAAGGTKLEPVGGN